MKFVALFCCLRSDCCLLLVFACLYLLGCVWLFNCSVDCLLWLLLFYLFDCCLLVCWFGNSVERLCFAICFFKFILFVLDCTMAFDCLLVFILFDWYGFIWCWLCDWLGFIVTYLRLVWCGISVCIWIVFVWLRLFWVLSWIDNSVDYYSCLKNVINLFYCIMFWLFDFDYVWFLLLTVLFVGICIVAILGDFFLVLFCCMIDYLFCPILAFMLQVSVQFVFVFMLFVCICFDLICLATSLVG